MENDYTLTDLHQRLAQYRKRYARHVQRKLANDRNGKKTTKRTLAAIENNAKWIHYYQIKIKEHGMECKR